MSIRIREKYIEKGEEGGEREREQACLKKQYQNHHTINKEDQWWKPQEAIVEAI